MALSIKLDRTSKLALYQQVAEQIKTHIGDGRLPAGAQLPTIRQLAADLGVTRLTIQNVYNELQAGGWIEAQVGRGTFVSRLVRPETLTPAPTLAPDDVLSDILKVNQIVGIRAMATADPDPALFPTPEFWHWLTRLLPEAEALLCYRSPQGDPLLRVEVAALLKEQGITTIPDEIIITSGATQGLSLVAQALARPGDNVIVEQPTFLGFLHILKAHNLQPLGVPLDGEGPDLARLEHLLQNHRPRFYYTIPNFHNPTGICMSSQRRRDLLSLTKSYGLTLVEDDIYGQLAYDAPPPFPLKVLDDAGSVVYLSSFSKNLAPGLRIGYVVAGAQLCPQLLTLRRAADLCGPALMQRALAGFLGDGGLKRHLRRVITTYRERRDILLEALQAYMPEPVRWLRPAGGFCCWLTLPRSGVPGELYRAALKRGLAITPGEAFLVEPEPDEQVRLCFGNQSGEGIRAGVELLGEVIREQLKKGQPQQTEPFYWLPPV
jgi:DNA-binding transcriptional MocR family regulator